MTGAFRPLFGPFSTNVLQPASKQNASAPDACQKEQPTVLCPKARYKVAHKKVEQNSRLEMAQSQSSGDGDSELENKAPEAGRSLALSESGGEEEVRKATEGVAGPATQAELSLVAGFTDSLSGFLQGQSSHGAEVIKPIAQNADSMQALLAGLNESLPPFAAGAPTVAADPVVNSNWQQTSNLVGMDFTSAFPIQTSQNDSMPAFRDFFSQQNSRPSTGVADHRFFQAPAQKLTPVTRRPAVERTMTETCVTSEKRKADWEDPNGAESHEDSEEMVTDAQGGSDKACEGRKSPRCLTRTEEQRMKDRAKAKRHRQRKKVQEANDKKTICDLEAEVERLRKALKESEDTQVETQKVVGTLEKEVELWKTAYRDLGKTMSDMLRVGGVTAGSAPSK